jgi:hypothetical protein
VFPVWYDNVFWVKEGPSCTLGTGSLTSGPSEDTKKLRSAHFYKKGEKARFGTLAKKSIKRVGDDIEMAQVWIFRSSRAQQ